MLGDEVYLARVEPTTETINTGTEWEYYAGGLFSYTLRCSVENVLGPSATREMYPLQSELRTWRLGCVGEGKSVSSCTSDYVEQPHRSGDDDLSSHHQKVYFGRLDRRSLPKYDPRVRHVLFGKR